MLPNGHKLVIERAVEAVGDESITSGAREILLGSLREDFWLVPLVHVALAGQGLSHFYRPGSRFGLFPLVPSAPARAERLLSRAVKAGRTRAGFFWLGRAAHLVSEMAAPVHAQRSIHWAGEAFETWVESHIAILKELSLPPIPRGDSARALAHDLACYCQRFACDDTRNLGGWLLYRAGRAHRPTEAEVAEQARALIPAGAAHTAALFRLFLERT